MAFGSEPGHHIFLAKYAPDFVSGNWPIHTKADFKMQPSCEPITLPVGSRTLLSVPRRLIKLMGNKDFLQTILV